jgi:bacterial/archaeal transporter family-2 protein
VPGAYVNVMFYLSVVGAVQRSAAAGSQRKPPKGAGLSMVGRIYQLSHRHSVSRGYRKSWPRAHPGLRGAGGIFGAISVLTVPRLGAATVLALIVIGQMLGSLAFDHFGLLGVPQHPASLRRLARTAFLILGVVLIRT